jgi:LAO/AO transport system kinase
VTPAAGSDGRSRGAALAAATLAGDRRALARLLTSVESRTPAAEAALRILHPRAGGAHVIGVTGAPGAGKSTLVSALVREMRARGRSVAVVAVDPSSPITGGAILGDRVRMQEHATDDSVFIRSMAARGHAGGIAATTDSVVTVLDAAGFDAVIVETVGTGQSEVEVAATADTTVVVEAPEMGDEIQAIKAGLLEVADIVVVSKGDRPGAERTANLLRSMLATAAVADDGETDSAAAPAAARAGGQGGAAAARAGRPAGLEAGGRAGRTRPKRPEVLLTTGATGAGVAALVDALDLHRTGTSGVGVTDARLRRAETLVWAIVTARVRDELSGGERAAETRALVHAVATHDIDPYAAADALLGARSDPARLEEGRGS